MKISDLFLSRFKLVFICIILIFSLPLVADGETVNSKPHDPNLRLKSNRTFGAFGNFGNFAIGVFFQNTGGMFTKDIYDAGANNVSGSFQPFAVNLGMYDPFSADLILKGAEMKTWRDNDANVCMPKMFYRVRTPSGPVPAYNSFDIPFLENCPGGAFPSGGPCNGNDQKWSSQTLGIDLTQFCEPGDYMLDVYFEEPGSFSNDGMCNQTVTNGSSTAPFTATFTIKDLPSTVSAGSNSAVCVGENIELTATFTANTSNNSATSWAWTGPDNFTSTDEDPAAFAATAAKAGTYKVIVTDDNGCKDSTTAVSYTHLTLPTTPSV